MGERLQVVPPTRTLSPNLFKVYINNTIIAVKAAKQGVTVGEDKVSGLMFADDFVEISHTPGRTAKTNRESTVEYTSKY